MIRTAAVSGKVIEVSIDIRMLAQLMCSRLTAWSRGVRVQHKVRQDPCVIDKQKMWENTLSHNIKESEIKHPLLRSAPKVDGVYSGPRANLH